jgi:hypothetical protein
MHSINLVWAMKMATPVMTMMVTTFALSAILALRPVFAWRGKDHAMPDDT